MEAKFFLKATLLMGCECIQVIEYFVKSKFVDISPLNKQIKAEGNLEYCKILAVKFYRHERVDSTMYSDVSTLRNILQSWCVPRRPE